jgi:group I intron endonuclease
MTEEHRADTPPDLSQISEELPIWIIGDQRIESGIYWIRCLIDNRVYVGSTINFSSRWSQHRSALNLNKHKNYRLQRVWNECGEEAFVFEVMGYVCDLSLLGVLEDEHIVRYQAADPRFGFNSLLAGRRYPEEIRRKLSEAKRGKLLSEEHRKKLSEAHRGMKHTDEARRKISESNRSRVYGEETLRRMSESQRGKKLSEEHKQKLREAGLNKKLSEEHKKKLRESRRGKPLSEEHKKKLSEARKGKKVSEETHRRMIEAQLRRRERERGV